MGGGGGGGINCLVIFSDLFLVIFSDLFEGLSF